MYASLPAVTPDVPGKILVSGYYGFGNAGDDSIAAALVAANALFGCCKKTEEAAEEAAEDTAEEA